MGGLGGTNPSPPCLEVTCGLRPLFCLRTAPPLTLPCLCPASSFSAFFLIFLLPHLLFLRSPLITRLFLAPMLLARVWPAESAQPSDLQRQGCQPIFLQYFSNVAFLTKDPAFRNTPTEKKSAKKRKCRAAGAEPGGSVWAEAEAIALKSGNN